MAIFSSNSSRGDTPLPEPVSRSLVRAYFPAKIADAAGTDALVSHLLQRELRLRLGPAGMLGAASATGRV